jgi:uncharacterized membrane protein
MTYDEFASKSLEYYMDMVRLIDIKQKYRMSLTEDEKQISDYIIETQERNKINELRNKFEKCWDIEE